MITVQDEVRNQVRGSPVFLPRIHWPASSKAFTETSTRRRAGSECFLLPSRGPALYCRRNRLVAGGYIGAGPCNTADRRTIMAISRREHMARTRKSPIRIRLRVANRPGQVFRAGKGRGSYRRAAARVQIVREQAEE